LQTRIDRAIDFNNLFSRSGRVSRGGEYRFEPDLAKWNTATIFRFHDSFGTTAIFFSSKCWHVLSEKVLLVEIRGKMPVKHPVTKDHMDAAELITKLPRTPRRSDTL
jgi:hypothetical protein